MTIVCKRVDFNNFKNSLIKLHSTVVTDVYNNKINMVCLQLNNKINMELEIIGDKVYIHKNIKKNSSSDKEILSFIVENLETIYTLKIIIKNDMDEKKLIYLGNYTFNIFTHTINKECNIKLIIKKKIVQKKIERDEEEHESEHESDHEREHESEHESEHGEEPHNESKQESEEEDITTQGDNDEYVTGSVDDDDEPITEDEEHEDDRDHYPTR